MVDWNKQVTNREREVEQLRSSQRQAAVLATNELKKQVAKLQSEKAELDRKVSQVISSTDIVTAPAGVRLFHDTAVSQGATPEERDAILARNSGRITGETETFKADAYASVLIQNIQEYNKLMAKYNALLDLMLRWKELADGINNKGANSPPSTALQ